VLSSAMAFLFLGAISFQLFKLKSYYKTSYLTLMLFSVTSFYYPSGINSFI